MARTQTPKRVAVTGLALLTPVGNTLETAWQAICEGRSGVGAITRFDTSLHKTKIAGELKGFAPEDHMEKKAAKRLDPFIQYAVAASRMAMTDSGLILDAGLAEKAGCCMGCGLGGLTTIESNHEVLRQRGPDRVSPFFVPMMIGNMAPGEVAIQLGLKGPNLMVSTACAASTHAIGWAYHQIRDNGYKVMFTGGSEAVITPLAVAGFNAVKALSTRNDAPEKASRPFDKDRDGFIIGEGSGVLVLEEWEHAQARGAKIYAEIAGFGASCDAFHFTAPPEDGSGARAAILAALEDAAGLGITPEDIGYVNAHGTSTELNDIIETRAIKDAFGEHAKKLAISSTKSMTGHLLGAAGGIEAAFTALALRDGILPPTINLENPSPECDLDYIPKTARKVKIKAALSNSFGFGGTNGCLVLKAVD